MSSVIGSLRVNLGLDSAQFERGARRVKDAQKTMRDQFRRVGAAAAAMGAAVTAAAIKGAKEIDETAKAARRLDASIGGFRALELAAQEAGVNLSSLTNDIQTMNREISAIGVSGNAERALTAIGLAASDIEGLDADAKIALIADQVAALGLDAGQTTAILRDLGVRNREMALLILQGGDAIRAARQDIADYGLEISTVDANRIEAANDAIARLGLVTQYAGQQLAVAIVPELGRMAEAMTNALREGGALRIVIDGLTENLDRVAAYVTAAVVLFGTRYVAAVVAARVATFSLAASLVALRTALIRTGIGALIVLSGELALRFSRLVERVGGFGIALGLLRNVAVEVFQRIKQSFAIVPAAIQVGTNKMVGFFANAIGRMAYSFVEFTWSVAEGLNGLFGTNLSGASGFITQELNRLAIGAEDAAAAASAEISSIAGAVSAPLESLAKLNAHVDQSAESVSDLGSRLDELGGSGGDAAGGGGGGGGSAGRAATAIERLKTEAEGFKAALTDAATTAEGFGRDKAQILTGGIDSVSRSWGQFIVSGGRDFDGFIGSVLDSFQGMLAEMIALQTGRQIFGQIFSGLFPGLPSIPSYAVGTSFHPGGLARVNERGGEILNLPRGTQVIPHEVSMQMAQNASRGATQFNLTVENNGSPQQSGEVEYSDGGRSAKLVLADAVGDGMRQPGGAAQKYLRSAGVRQRMPGR